MSVSFDISHPEIQGAVRRALAEDIGGGDVTSQVCVPAECEAHGTFLAREQQIVAGTELLPLIYEMRGGVEELCIHKFSEASAQEGQALATLRGRAHLPAVRAGKWVSPGPRRHVRER